MKWVRENWEMVLLGISAGFLSIVALYAAFYGGIFSDDFLLFIPIAIFLGSISFVCFSPWKHINFLIGGIWVSVVGVWFLSLLFEGQDSDFWGILIWALFLLSVGLSLILRFFSRTFFGSIRQICQTKTVRLAAKIIFWIAIAITGVFVLIGFFSIIAGISATTVIIILLFLILMKDTDQRND